jgi:hypothetical protein
MPDSPTWHEERDGLVTRQRRHRSRVTQRRSSNLGRAVLPACAACIGLANNAQAPGEMLTLESHGHGTMQRLVVCMPFMTSSSAHMGHIPHAGCCRAIHCMAIVARSGGAAGYDSEKRAKPKQVGEAMQQQHSSNWKFTPLVGTRGAAARSGRRRGCQPRRLHLCLIHLAAAVNSLQGREREARDRRHLRCQAQGQHGDDVFTAQHGPALERLV